MDDFNERQALIDRILREKGTDAFDDMIKLLEDEDENVREIAAEVIYRLGESVVGKLEEILKNAVKNGERNKISLLYIIDLLGDLNAKRSVKDILKALELYDLEESQLIIYEALAKLGAGEQFYPLLRYMLLEGEERFLLGPQVAIVMSYLDIPEVVHDFVDAIDSDDFSGEDLEIIKQALTNIINIRPTYKEILINIVGEDNFEKYIVK
ncbi:MAG: HEAT repeat domain-containing protein [Fervidobacterium sp.]|nr:HEAT repeat domain-containing protein [Fervidobacterium sp.]